VRTLRLVELEGTGERLQHALGNPDPGKQRHLLPAEPGHAPVLAIPLQTRLLRRDPCSPGGQELADLVPGVHTTRVTPLGAG
jgi:hypothetical protein